MISSKRRKQAKREGKMAAIRTNCNPNNTKNPYHKYSVQGRAFSKGFSIILNRMKFLRKL